MMKVEGRTAGGQSAASANGRERPPQDGEAAVARAVGMLRRLVREARERLGMNKRMKVHVSLEFDEFGYAVWRSRWVFRRAEESVAGDTLEECLSKLAARGSREYLRAEADRTRRRIEEFRDLARDLDDLTIEDDRRAREALERLCADGIAREGGGDGE